MQAAGKHVLGLAAGLTQFGVNLTRLKPGVWSSQRHWHAKEDEFVYVLEGEVMLLSDDGEEALGRATARASRRGRETVIAFRTSRSTTP